MTSEFDQQKIIFVLGNSRSGTTMLGRILGRASDVFTFNELHFFEQMWLPQIPAERIKQETAIEYAARLIAVQRDGYYTRPDLDKYRSEAMELIQANPTEWTAPQVYATFVKYEAGRRGKSVACDQTPRNLFYLNEILQLYPGAYAVHIIRDPRDVLLSQKNRWRRRAFTKKAFPLKESIRSWVNYHPISISLLWRSGIRAWEKIKNHPRVYSFRFEDLLENPEQTVREVCRHLEIEFSPEMLEVPQVGSSHGTDHPNQFGVNKAIAGRWQRSSKTDFVDLHICQKILEKFMVKLNYPLAKFSLNPLYYLWVMALWPFKATMAVLVNLDKSSNIITFVRRRLG